MKHLLILTIGICLLISVPVVADQAEDEAAVRKVTEQFYVAWNNHDAKACLAFIDENCIFWSVGKCSSLYEKGFPEQYKNSQAKLYEDMGVDFITPDVSVHKFRYEASGVLDADGKTLPSEKLLRAVVYIRKSGKWLIRAQFTRETAQ